MGKKGKLDLTLLKKHTTEPSTSRSRHQTRRAASKEALKQMQMLLEDEKHQSIEIPDDDDEEVVPISSFPSPTKKKYKLSHRKSSDGNDREVLVLKTIKSAPSPSIDNESLDLECWVEDLEPCQLARNKKLQEEELAFKSKLDELIKGCKGELVHTGEFGSIWEFTNFVDKTVHGVDNSNAQPNIVLNNNITNPQPGYQLVMDPRLGLVLGTVQPAGSPLPVQPSTSDVPRTTVATAISATRTSKPKKILTAVPTPVARSVMATKQPSKRPPIAPHVTRSKTNVVNCTKLDSATKGKVSTISSSNVKAAESTVEGGLATGKKHRFVVDLTGDDGKPTADSREVTFNKLQGKTYPSLAVVARPYLRLIDVNLDRSKLDSKVKTVLMCAPAKFAEWLIQQGLIKSEQKCSFHNNPCKLGMYTDVSKFPHSGGYVWISECCPQKFVSVFSGSIFESSPHPPLVMLKVLYHWACQTNIQNVIQWVKVDSLFVKGMYSWLRSVCTVATQTHIKTFGGPQVKVEVGVISLGTTSQDGNSRQVKVEVLGVLETATKQIRLRAIEPLGENDRGYKKRFLKILEPLTQWVHTNSTIVTDLTVDKSTLYQLGFYNVIQNTSSDASNKTVMDYLRRIVPRMFQNTLSLLSRPIIQQFLDELVWRERYGTTALDAFDNLLVHLAEQTRSDLNESIVVRLNRISANPFKNWALTIKAPTIIKISSNTSNNRGAEPIPKKRKRKVEKDETELNKLSQAGTSNDVARPSKSVSPDIPEHMVPLENYYYGIINNYSQQSKANITLNMKCPLCKETFHNNILLMTHLFRHAHNISKGEMCKYCLACVPTVNELTKHIAAAHPSETKNDRGFVCLICETSYMNPFVLGKHMSREHCPAELPYQCGTCGYRCSNHKQSIDHFYAQHDNGPTIQCPFCLKSTTVFSSSRNIVQNMSFFLQHLQKHQKKQFARRCGKCNLWFVQKELKTEHQNKMHSSQRFKHGLTPLVAPRNGIMVPKSKMDKYPCDAEGINFNTLYFNVPKAHKCKECNTAMDTPKHFPSFENCPNRNCQYSTCCAIAMQEHNLKCKKNSIPEEKLPFEMFCICGFSSSDGNQLAKHLASCEKKSAYPSMDDAKNASVTRSMLDVLGLVRKPEESLPGTSTEGKKINKSNNPNFYTLESDDDDDVIAIDEPPKKKLKENITEKNDDNAVVEIPENEESKTILSSDAMETIAKSEVSTIESNPKTGFNFEDLLTVPNEKSAIEADETKSSSVGEVSSDQSLNENDAADMELSATELPQPSDDQEKDSEENLKMKNESELEPNTDSTVTETINQIEPKEKLTEIDQPAAKAVDKSTEDQINENNILLDNQNKTVEDSNPSQEIESHETKNLALEPKEEKDKEIQLQLPEISKPNDKNALDTDPEEPKKNISEELVEQPQHGVESNSIDFPSVINQEKAEDNENLADVVMDDVTLAGTVEAATAKPESDLVTDDPQLPMEASDILDTVLPSPDKLVATTVSDDGPSKEDADIEMMATAAIDSTVPPAMPMDVD